MDLETWEDPGTLGDQEIWVQAQAAQETWEPLEVESRSIRGVPLRVEMGVLITTEIAVEMVPFLVLVLAENQASNLLLLPSIKSR